MNAPRTRSHFDDTPRLWLAGPLPSKHGALGPRGRRG
jgi:hypothetical protein